MPLALPQTRRVEQLTVSLAMIDALDVQLDPLNRELRSYARRQTGCKALIDQYYGIGEMCAVTVLAELGDCRQVLTTVEMQSATAGMDITVYQSDRHRAPGHLSRQGPPALRWALYEAAQAARRPGSARPRVLPPGGRATRRATAPASHSRANCSSAATTRSENSARTPSHRPRRRDGVVTELRAARQAAARSRDRALQQPTSVQTPWPLDPGFGSAVPQRVPAKAGTRSQDVRQSQIVRALKPPSH